MQITIEVPDDIVQWLSREGVPVDQYVKELLDRDHMHEGLRHDGSASAAAVAHSEAAQVLPDLPWNNLREQAHEGHRH